MDLIELMQGLIIGFSLIIAIGPQNLFVIHQGLKKKYVFVVCLICSVSDTFLIILGILLSIYLSRISPNIVDILKLIGSLWLIIYGLIKIIYSVKKKIVDIEKNTEKLSSTILIALAFTFLNPHVYLDTIVLIGSISLNFDNKLSFGLGVSIASFIFFFNLGYFSKYLSNFIHNKKWWVLIDMLFGFLMIFYGIIFIINI